MKQVQVIFISWFLSAFSYKALAQEETKVKDNEKKTEEIIIRKKGDKDINLSIQITGDKVMVNGKPLIEFNDDNIVIHKRNITVRNNALSQMQHELENLEMENFGWNHEGGSKVMLGVTTEKKMVA